MLPNLQLNSALTCRLVGGLAREQRSVCREAPDATSIAFEGLQIAVKECQHQFRWHRWNCSSLAVRSSNPHASSIMKRGKWLVYASVEKPKWMPLGKLYHRPID
ncbi:Protein Wnt [Operophtera brumata]|uniref:Protein Wnt n=1 Tax=Operophtera brumata TaxID=104452 RepID=A0A0L7L6F0_OPEBR|nr:Protein Wnt [Operophtera brumata]